MGKKVKNKSNRNERRKLERGIQKGSVSNLSPEQLLYRIKYQLTPNQSEPLLESLTDQQFNSIIGNKLPKNYDELRNLEVIYPDDEFHKELLWYSSIIKDYTEEINSFLLYKRQFEICFLKGAYHDAGAILSEIEQKICVSHWTLQKRLLLAEYEHGFITNKETLTGIISQNKNVITDIVAKYSSIRVERNLSYVKYCEILNGFIYVYKDPKIIEYLNYKLNFFTHQNYTFKGFILNAESAGSIIDMYLAFIDVITMSAAQRAVNQNESVWIKDVLSPLVSLIADNRIKFLLFSLGNACVFETKLESDYQTILNTYTKGDYYSTKELATTFLNDNADCFEIYEIYVKACIHLKIPCDEIFLLNSIGNRFIVNIYNILQKNNETSNSLYELQQIVNAVGLTNWSYKACSFFYNQHSISGVYLNIAKFSHLYGDYQNPMLSIYLQVSDSSIKYLEGIRDNEFNLDLINFWHNLSSDLFNLNVEKLPTKVEYFRQRLYSLQILQVQNRFSEALLGYNQLLENYKGAFYNLEEIIHGTLYCYLNLNNIVAALELVVNSNLKNQNLHLRLINEYLIDKLKSTNDEVLVANLAHPIFLHQYQKYISIHDLWVSYDNFLNSYQLNYPHEIYLIKDKFEQDKLIYLLKNVCKQEVYDSSYLFESQEELDNERIEICLLLTELDKSNFETYINEIAEISRNQLIRKGIKQIDESKIYVDVNGIRRTIEKDLKESFLRNINLLSLPLSQIEKLNTSDDNVIVPYYGKSSETNKVEFNNSNIKITTYSRFSQFKDMFFKVRDMFIASNEFGIDTYLSMRIRHGTLLGEIRSIFENQNLITKKVDTSEKYQENIFWLNKGLVDNVEIKQEFNSLMSDFSLKIDGISNMLKNKQLQISTEKKPTEGLFDYAFSENELLSLFSEIGAIEEYEEFFEAIIKYLWDRTEINLSVIREEISVPIKERMTNSLGQLSRDLEALISKTEHPELNELLNNITFCQTDIANELDKISEWFRRTNNKVINEFDLNLPIEATLATLKRFYKDYNNFTPSIVNNCDILFEGDTFPHFTYIMQNLFDNIFKHAKVLPADLHVDILINQIDSKLHIEIQNNFTEEIDLEVINKKIDNTREQLLIKTHDRTRTEDGTGYLKIKKTIVSDLAREDYKIIIHNVDETRLFKTELVFEITNLQKNSNENPFN
jgi:hypothetical protein